jgi:hypothetical protein
MVRNVFQLGTCLARNTASVMKMDRFSDSSVKPGINIVFHRILVITTGIVIKLMMGSINVFVPKVFMVKIVNSMGVSRNRGTKSVHSPNAIHCSKMVNATPNATLKNVYGTVGSIAAVEWS